MTDLMGGLNSHPRPHDPRPQNSKTKKVHATQKRSAGFLVHEKVEKDRATTPRSTYMFSSLDCVCQLPGAGESDQIQVAASQPELSQTQASGSLRFFRNPDCVGVSAYFAPKEPYVFPEVAHASCSLPSAAAVRQKRSNAPSLKITADMAIQL